MQEFIIFGIPIVLLVLGLFAGGHAERQHLQALRQREAATREILLTQIKSFPGFAPGPQSPRIIYAEVVIASDYLKTFLAGLRNFFGGEVRSFQTMLVRARREATLRILEQARQQGFNAVCNLRLETADVGGNASTRGKKGMVMAAILASATAYHVGATDVPTQP